MLPLSSPRMGATVFVQPLDLVKNRMQLSGEGAKTREYKTSFHALTSILRAEGLRGIYTGYWGQRMGVGCGLTALDLGLTQTPSLPSPGYQLACCARPPTLLLALVSIPCCLSA